MKDTITFTDYSLYLAALYQEAMMWDNGKPEWERKQPTNFQYADIPVKPARKRKK